MKYKVNLTIGREHSFPYIVEGVIETEEEPILPFILPPSEGLGKTLKRLRQLKGLTLVQLSQLSGVSASHLARIERGERFPGGRILAKLERGLKECL